MEIKNNIWLEIDGQVILSVWRLNLLRAIETTGSISQGAKTMNISYRRAWEKIHQAEVCLGFKLVETQIGGTGGGGAHLTPACLILLNQYSRLIEGVQNTIQERFWEIFGENLVTKDGEKPAQ